MDPLDRISQERAIARREATKQYATNSRDRLRRNIETKIRTTMIGALSAVEERLGRLWGQGKPRGQLTADELKWDAVKDELRTDILNLGNNQLRAAIAELEQYQVVWQRFHIEPGVGQTPTD